MKQKTLSPSSRDVLPLLLRVSQGLKYVFGKPESDETTVLQIQVLGLLRALPGMSAKELSEALYLSSSATAQLLQRMFDAGLLAREPDARDRRKIMLSMTETGESILEKYVRSRRENIKEVLSVLTDEETKALVAGLAKLHTAMQEKYHER